MMSVECSPEGENCTADRVMAFADDRSSIALGWYGKDAGEVSFPARVTVCLLLAGRHVS
jgi:hypothetical protein